MSGLIGPGSFEPIGAADVGTASYVWFDKNPRVGARLTMTAYPAGAKVGGADLSVRWLKTRVNLPDGCAVSLYQALV